MSGRLLSLIQHACIVLRLICCLDLASSVLNIGLNSVFESLFGYLSLLWFMHLVFVLRDKWIFVCNILVNEEISDWPSRMGHTQLDATQGRRIGCVHTSGCAECGCGACQCAQEGTGGLHTAALWALTEESVCLSRGWSAHTRMGFLLLCLCSCFRTASAHRAI